jgi:hypothetical protein
MRHHRVLGLGAAVLLASMAPAAHAFHTTFQYGVDRFEADGNLYGAADGTLDFVDEFDDGALAPNWRRFFGTVSEADGFMLLSNPGTHFTIPGLPFETDQSDAVSDAPVVRNGAGDLVLRAFWRPQMVGTNHYLQTTVWAGSYFVGLAFTNFDASIANLYNPPWPIGPTVTAHREFLVGLTLITLDRQHVPLGDGSPTGAFVFEIAYDDTAKQVTTAFSVDGGESYQGGFTPMPLPEFTTNPDLTGTLLIGADPYEAPGGPVGCDGFIFPRRLGVSGVGRGAGAQTFKVKGVIGTPAGFDIGAEGATLFVTDDVGAVLTVEMPAGPGCMPGDGWVQQGSVYRYRNDSGALPPACTPGSGETVRAIVRFDGAYDAPFKVKVKRTTIPTVSGGLDLDLLRGVPVVLPGCQDLPWDGYTCEARGTKLKCF